MARDAGAAPRRLSIALVFPACHRRGGVERVVREHARWLAGRHQVTFVGEQMDSEGMEGVAFVPLSVRAGPRALSALEFRRAAAAHLRDHRYDAVVSFGANCPPGDLQDVQSVHRAWLRSSAAIPTRFGSVPAAARYLMPQHLILLGLERSYFRSSTPAQVLATSEQTGREVAGTYGVPPTRVTTLPNGFDPAEFSTDVRQEHREPMRRRLAAGRDEIVLLFVANELHRKGFGSLLTALGSLDDPRLHLHVVGRVDPGSYAPRIEAAGLSDRVHWHGPQPDVAPFYAAADLFVLPTQYEPFGNVIIEALAMGVPVITTRLAGAAAAITHGRNGLLLDDPMDADELTRALRSATDPEQLRALSAEAPRGLAPYEWAALAARLEQAILDVVASRPEGHGSARRSRRP